MKIFNLLYLFCFLSGNHSNSQNTDNHTSKIDSLVKITNPRNFNGIIYITKNNKLKYSKAMGFTNFEKRKHF